MDPVSVFGIVTGAAGLLDITARVVAYLAPGRHLGSQVKNLKEILEDLQHVRVRIVPENEEDIQAIIGLVKDSNDLLEDYKDAGGIRPGRFGLRFYWPRRLESKIEEISKQLLRRQRRLIISAVA